ncbi:deoxyribodipyrimidine photo-lyase [Oculatella sp. LEGE 06141]|uniref:FAD-binding domain-containing protein n=1 Tax=Oculatella sp. LEGE 06141 TaxID=1828648 RepID=UPI00187F9A9A|nr:FAD-binding domain-containing protein [Oculatella sp. LEGE 06141]MBE9177207.1 deoxyribodipyrimidine photo-lyase [Oculatella sp. LEGE 06141]
MQPLRTNLESRNAIADYIQTEFPFLENTGCLSPHVGGRKAGLERLQHFPLEKYARQRNFLDGAVSQLSPYLSRGCITLEEVRQWALQHQASHSVEKFVSELAWRAFFHLVYQDEGDRILQDLEPPKVPMRQHQTTLPDDIDRGETGIPSMDTFIRMLKETGYLHNHARMYLASYIVHFRQVHWRTGADWMYALLIDGDLASNHLSWQWVASTFSHKPYIFNRENLERYAGSVLPGDPRKDDPFNYSYEELADRLFGNDYTPASSRASGNYR